MHTQARTLAHAAAAHTPPPPNPCLASLLATRTISETPMDGLRLLVLATLREIDNKPSRDSNKHRHSACPSRNVTHRDVRWVNIVGDNGEVLLLASVPDSRMEMALDHRAQPLFLCSIGYPQDLSYSCL